MKRKMFFAATLAAVMALGLAGCGQAKTTTVGLVTETGEGYTSTANELAGGINSFTSENSAAAKLYKVTDSSEDAYTTAFDQAAKDGAGIVVTVSGNAEVPLYKAQKAHKNTRYIIFSGAPRKNADDDASLRKNTVSVAFSAKDMGFMSGYAAVKNGFRNLGFLSGEETDTSDAYKNGFVSGAEYAAQEDNLTAGGVIINTEFAGTDELMPLRATDAMTWYENGCEFIVTDKPSLAPALLTAANAEDGKTCGFLGFTPTTDLSTDCVLFSSVPDYEGATEAMLTAAAKGGNSFSGGKTVECGFTEKAIRLETNFSNLQGLTEDAYNNFRSAAQTGLELPDKITIVTESEQQPVNPAALSQQTTEATSEATLSNYTQNTNG
ncbi:MAG: BMP family ABC transporter substrate-binding protein [Lachnospiraceae bacterium]|nr:BMP family ABC transporter substrate-binding protein [Lachnospiraceae bacterium]